MKAKFIKHLQNNDTDGLQLVPKSDLHNHATRGGNIKDLLKNHTDILSNLPNKFTNLADMQSYYESNIKHNFKGLHGFVNRVEGAFKQAKRDGIEVLALSFGLGDVVHYEGNISDYFKDIKQMHQRIAPNINLIPEITLSRESNVNKIFPILEEALSLNYIKSIDLVGNEELAIESFVPIYRLAESKGLILRAHIGEFSDANTIRNTVETLHLNQVQHGVRAVDSAEVMRYLAQNKIQLNICPTSNVMLSVVNSYREHPVSLLFDHGIPITLNTDDMLIFNKSVSEEYLALYNNGVLSANELNEIRELGLRQSI